MTWRRECLATEVGADGTATEREAGFSVAGPVQPPIPPNPALAERVDHNRMLARSGAMLKVVLISTTVHSIAPLSWAVIVGAAVFAGIGGYTGVCFWTGRRIVPWTPAEAMDQLRVLGVTLLPGTVMWTAGFLIGVTSRIGAHLHAHSARMAVDLVSLLLGIVAIGAAGVGASLFFFTKPRRFVPPRYRKL
jgi:hypothetical protein